MNLEKRKLFAHIEAAEMVSDNMELTGDARIAYITIALKRYNALYETKHNYVDVINEYDKYTKSEKTHMKDEDEEIVITKQTGLTEITEDLVPEEETSKSKVTIERPHMAMTAVFEKETHGLSHTKVKDLREIFYPFIDELQDQEEDYNKIISEKSITQKLSKRARKLRLAFKSKRTNSSRLYVAECDHSKKVLKALNTIFDKITGVFKERESALKEIEEYEDRRLEAEIYKTENERAEQLKNLLSKYKHPVNLTILSSKAISLLSDDDWDNYLNTTEGALNYAEHLYNPTELKVDTNVAPSTDPAIAKVSEMMCDEFEKAEDPEEAISRAHEKSTPSIELLSERVLTDTELLRKFAGDAHLSIKNALPPKLKNDDLQAYFSTWLFSLSSSLKELTTKAEEYKII